MSSFAERAKASIALLFDLDGTLTDPKAGLVGCVRHAFDRLGVACPPEEVLTTFIGPPLRNMFANLLNTTDVAVIESAVGFYRERYSTMGVYENRAYDDIDAMLARCANLTPMLFTATSKPTIFAEHVLKNLGLSHYFVRVYGAALDGRLDDKTHLLRHLFAEERIEPSCSIMIGDRAADIIAAKANGVRSIGVLWGYGSAEELREAGADALCPTPKGLQDCVLGLL